MAENKKYVVFSNGFVLTGFETEEVAASLAERYGTTTKRILKRLLAGKAAKVKSFHDYQSAEKLARKLAQLGLNCYVFSPEIEDELEEENSRYSEEHTFHTVAIEDSRYASDPYSEMSVSVTHVEHSHSNSIRVSNPPQAEDKGWRKRGAIVLSVIALSAILGFIALKHWLVSPVPKSIDTVEAIWFEDTLPQALLHADILQIRKLSQLAGAGEIQDGMLAMTAHRIGEVITSSPEISQSAGFLSMRLDLNEQATSNPFSSPPLQWTAILTGAFDRPRVISELSDFYSVESLSDELFKLTPKVVDDGEDDEAFECADQSQKADASIRKEVSHAFAHISPEMLIVADRLTSVSTFTESLSNYAVNEENSAPLASWKKFRGQNAFSIRLFGDALLKGNFIVEAAADEVLDDLSFINLGLRLTPRPLSQGLHANIQLESSDKEGLKNIASELTSSIKEVSNKHSESFPALTRLFSRVEIENTDALDVNVLLDQGVLSEVQDLTSDAIAMLMFGGNDDFDVEDTVIKDVIHENPWDYSKNRQFTSSKPIAKDAFAKFRSLYETKGIEIHAGSLKMAPISQFKPENGSAMQLSLMAKRGIPEVQGSASWYSGLKQSFGITSVLDEQGNDLLEDERCKGQSYASELNHQASEQTSDINDAITTSKTVRLKDGVRPGDVRKVTGKYGFEIPVSVYKESLSLEGKRQVKFAGGSFRLNSISGDTVSYTLRQTQGNEVAEVRALNANGDTLRSVSTFGISDNYDRTFKGQVKSIEVYIVDEWHKEEFDFALDSVRPEASELQKRFNSTAVSNEPLTLFDLNALAKFESPITLAELNDSDLDTLKDELRWKDYSISAEKPGELGAVSTKSSLLFWVHDLANRWKNSLTVGVVSPFEETVVSNSSLMVLELELGGKSVETPKPNISKLTINGKPQPRFKLEERGYALAEFDVTLPEDQQEIDSIKGALVFTLPTAIKQTEIALSNNESDDPIIEFLGFDYTGSTGMSYGISAQFGSPYAAKLIGQGGLTVLADMEIQMDGSTVLKFDSVGEFDKIVLYWVSDSITIRDPFELKPKYSQ